ncbi:MAG: hypothetical protein IJW68_06635 [Bacteroidaceae bacterium]|nr:hypothetical protein [Bacteroidaceae bacterium]
MSGKSISWERVNINGNKQINLDICKHGHAVNININGDVNDGNYIIDIPYCVNNIADVKVEGGKLVGVDSEKGKAVVSGDSKKITITFIK